MLNRLLSDDRGVTITELMVTSLILSIAAAVITSLFLGFMKTADFEYDLADAERETRPVLREMLIQVRQAIPRAPGGNIGPVAYLDWGTLAVYSDSLPYDNAPELFEYKLVNCSNGVNGGVCELQLTITQPDSIVGPPWDYTGPPESSRILLYNVLADAPGVDPTGYIFQGVRWEGSPLAEVAVPSCQEGTATPCDVTLVDIKLRVDPSLIAANPRVYVIEEKVRLRNA